MGGDGREEGKGNRRIEEEMIDGKGRKEEKRTEE